MTTSLADESGLLTELRQLAEQGRHRDVVDRLSRLPAGAIAQRAPLALLAAEAHGRLGDYEVATRWADAAYGVARSRGDRYTELRVLNTRGAIALETGDAERGEHWFAAALDLCRALPPAPTPDLDVLARCLNNLGIIANLRGDSGTALANYQLALAAYEQAGQARGMAGTHHNIAISRLHLGDIDGAIGAADQAVRIAGRLQDERLAAQALAGRAEVHLATGDATLAAAELERAAASYERLRHPVGLAEARRLQAAVARAQGNGPAAVRLLNGAAALAREHGSAHTLAEIERDLGAALESLGDVAGARAARERAIPLYRGLGAEQAAQQLTDLIA